MAIGWYVIEPPDSGVLASFTQKVTAAMSGQVPISGTMFTSQIPKLASAMLGLVSPAGGLNTVLPKVSSNLAGTQQQSGVAASLLKGVAAAMSAAQTESGSIASTLPKVSSAMIGSVIQSGAIASTLQKTSAAMAGGQTQTGSVASTLPKMSASLLEGGFTGDLASTLPKVNAALVGEQDQIATMASTLPKVNAAMVGEQDQIGSVASTLPKVSAALAGVMQPNGAMASTLAKASASMVGAHTQSGSMGSTLRKVSTALVGSQITPVAFDVMGAGTAGFNGFITSAGGSWTHTVTSGLANVAMIVIFDVRYGGQTRAAQTTYTVTIGGVQMTLLNFAQINSEHSVEMWGALNVGTGAKSMVLSVGNATNTGREIVARSFSYANVGSFGTATQATGSGTTPAITYTTAAVNDMVACAYGSGVSGNGANPITAVTQNSRVVNINSGDGFAQMAAADAAGAASVAFSGTISGGNTWGVVACQLAHL